MARFIYRMQNVLEIKLKIEDQAKTEFATAKMHLDEEEEKLRFLMDRRIYFVSVEKCGKGQAEVRVSQGTPERSHAGEQDA